VGEEKEVIPVEELSEQFTTEIGWRNECKKGRPSSKPPLI